MTNRGRECREREKSESLKLEIDENERDKREEKRKIKRRESVDSERGYRVERRGEIKHKKREKYGR